ncbi:hypothetical protein SSX86_010112 [Deinandra increscens subsp. villosa]|uniref:RRM domain-containing protein n=1 Tax=Deinandra increscens subsp. villosa TaxID=3103831 RepID=A0AAP0H032_9ASTR
MSSIPHPYDHADDEEKPNAINTTLSVSGLPEGGVDPYKIHNLFCSFPEKAHSPLSYPSLDLCKVAIRKAVGFAKFVNHQSAIGALYAMDGKFYPQILSGLHIELARSNYNRRNKTGDGKTEEPSELNKDASTKRLIDDYFYKQHIFLLLIQ